MLYVLQNILTETICTYTYNSICKYCLLYDIRVIYNKLNIILLIYIILNFIRFHTTRITFNIRNIILRNYIIIYLITNIVNLKRTWIFYLSVCLSVYLCLYLSNIKYWLYFIIYINFIHSIISI